MNLYRQASGSAPRKAYCGPLFRFSNIASERWDLNCNKCDDCSETIPADTRYGGRLTQRDFPADPHIIGFGREIIGPFRESGNIDGVSAGSGFHALVQDAALGIGEHDIARESAAQLDGQAGAGGVGLQGDKSP